MNPDLDFKFTAKTTSRKMFCCLEAGFALCDNQCFGLGARGTGVLTFPRWGFQLHEEAGLADLPHLRPREWVSPTLAVTSAARDRS